MIPREILHEILQPGGVVVAIATAIFAGSGWQDRKRKAAAGGTTTPAEAAQQHRQHHGAQTTQHPPQLVGLDGHPDSSQLTAT